MTNIVQPFGIKQGSLARVAPTRARVPGVCAYCWCSIAQPMGWPNCLPGTSVAAKSRLRGTVALDLTWYRHARCRAARPVRSLRSLDDEHAARRSRPDAREKRSPRAFGLGRMIAEGSEVFGSLPARAMVRVPWPQPREKEGGSIKLMEPPNRVRNWFSRLIVRNAGG
jgi:hypothetical protein